MSMIEISVLAATNQESRLLPHQRQVSLWYFIQNQTVAETHESLIATFPEVAPKQRSSQ